jgi:alpha-ribazole phosphatase
MPHRFWLVRHALVDAAALAYLYGTNDVPLCETALADQAGTFAGLAARLPHRARLICTPLTRTQATHREIVAAGYPPGMPAIDAAFVEQDRRVRGPRRRCPPPVLADPCRRDPTAR